MKQLFKSLVLVASVAASLISCQKEQNSPEVKEAFKLTVHAKAENLSGDTKTYISGKQVLWGTGEYMTAALVSGEDLATYNSNSTSADTWSGESEAKFEFDVELSAAPVTYGGIYPTSAVVPDNNKNATSFKVNLSAMQSATAASYDPSAYIMIAKPETFTEATSEWTASFRRTTALNKITLTGLEDNITSVKITVPEGKYLAGRRYMDLTTGDKGEVYNLGGRTNALTINYSTPIASDVEDKDIWFTSWGVEIPQGSKMTVVAYSNDYSYTREITAREGGIKFNEGFLNTLSINMASAVKESLIDYSGDYLIVNGVHLLTDFNSEKSYYNYVDAEGSELADFWEIADIEDYVWTVAKLADGSYSFCNSGTGKYLALTADENAAHEAANADENTARFTIAEENSALTICSKAYPGRKLRCYTSSPRFAFYGSSSTSPVASLLAYTPDSRPTFDTVSGLSWDASGKTLSWTVVEGATNGYEYTKDNGETVTASETNSIDCSSWSNGDYSVKVRVVGTEEKKTSQWSDACAFTISGGAEKSILSFDFVTHPTGWPIGKESAAEGSYNYTLDDETYTFTHSKSGDGIYCGGTSNTSGYLLVTKSNTLGLPAIDGYKLTKVVGTLNGSGSPSTQSEVSITDGTNVITGGTSQTWNTKGGSYTYNLTSTEENTVYYLSVSNTANCQITKLELTYEITSPLVSIAVSGTANKVNYFAGDSFDTDGLIVTATYADASTKDVTSSVEWTVTPETLSAGTTSVTVVAKYKGIQSNEYVVNGLSVKSLSSITVKTAPTKTTYTEGEKFNPAGLVIYRNYSDETKDEYAYTDHENEFTFDPDLATALATSNTSVTITYSGKSVSQAITVNEKPALETMDAIFAAATTTEADAKVKFNNWVVSAVKNDNAYVTDGTKGLIIYTSDHGFEVGDILSGTVSCTLVKYYGSSELQGVSTQTTGLTVTKGGTTTPATISIADLSGVNTGAVITFENLTYTGNEMFSDGANSIKLYNTFSVELPTLTSGNKYTVTGIYIQYNSTKEISPRATNDIVPFTGPYLNATASATSVAAAGGEVTITVDTNVEGWTATSSDNTNFAISNKTATSFDVTVSENTSTTDTRSATITVSATGVESKVITLTQSKKSSGTGPAVGTVLWGENFAHFGTNTPSAAGTGTGTTIYGETSITYAQSSTNTKGYNATYAGGTAPELLLSKEDQTWTISGIPCNGVSEMSLTFLSNRTTFAVSSSTTGITVEGSQKSWTIKNTGATTFTLEIKNTGSDNARIDDVVLKVTAN